MKGILPVGFDFGRRNINVYGVIDKKVEKIVSQNCICDGYEIRNMEEVDIKIEDRINYLDVIITKDSDDLGHHFVGALANKENKNNLRTVANSIEKFSDENLDDECIKLVTYLGYLLYKSAKKEFGKFRIGTGSPIEEYFEKNNNIENFKEKLKGRFTIEFVHKCFSGFKTTIEIDDIDFTSEGAATLLSALYRYDLKEEELTKNTRMLDYLENGPVIGINIGSSTFDISKLKSDLTFDSTGFIGRPIGSSQAINQVRNNLKAEYGYLPTLIEGDFLVRNYDEIKYKSNNINLKELSYRAYGNLISSIKNDLHDQVELNGLSIYDCSAIFLSGGTVETINQHNELRTKMESLVPGIPSWVSSDPLYDEAKGYFIVSYTNLMQLMSAERKANGVDSSKRVIEIDQ